MTAIDIAHQGAAVRLSTRRGRLGRPRGSAQNSMTCIVVRFFSHPAGSSAPVPQIARDPAAASTTGSDDCAP
jgi:hypothetical protein